MNTRFLTMVSFVLVAGCSLDLSNKVACLERSDCASGQMCSEGQCMALSTLEDGGRQAVLDGGDHVDGDQHADDGPLSADAGQPTADDSDGELPDASAGDGGSAVTPALDAGTDDGQSDLDNGDDGDVDGVDLDSGELDGSEGDDDLADAGGPAREGLTLWLRADEGVESTQAGVIRWLDQSGSGFHAAPESAVPFSAPVLDPVAGPSGGPAIMFDGVDDLLTLGANYIFSDSDGMTFFLVMRSDADRSEAEYSDPMVFSFGKGANYDYCLQYDQDTIALRADNVGATFTQHTVGQGNWAIVTYQFIFRSVLRARIDGEDAIAYPALMVEKLTAEEIYESPIREWEAGPVTIGGQSKQQMDYLRFFQGGFAELLVYDIALTKVARDDVECELSVKYGIPIQHACD